jgi:hypothetical protein
MTRKRMLHTKIWDSDQFAELKVRERLLYIALISNADDYGCFRLDAKFWKRKVFYNDKIGAPSIQLMLDKLIRSGLIGTYNFEGGQIGHHPKWKQYQKLRSDRPKTSDFEGFMVVGQQPNVIPTSDKVSNLTKENKEIDKILSPREQMLKAVKATNKMNNLFD